MVLGEGIRLSGIGLAIGMIGAYLVGRATQSSMYGVKALDLTAFSAVAAILLSSALRHAASRRSELPEWIRSWRCGKTDQGLRP